MKKIISIVLSIVLTLSLLPVCVVPTTAEGGTQSEPLFSVSVSGNTFTVTRSESWKQQTVAYRTVSVTAVEGIHFTRATGSLTFGVGETSKTVTVTETDVGNVPVRYRYQSGNFREYRLEVLDNYGLLLATGTRKINYGASYQFNNACINRPMSTFVRDNATGFTTNCVDVDCPNTSSFTDVTDAGYKQGVHNISTNALFQQSGVAPRDYLSAIGDKIYAAVRFMVKEKNNGYQYIQILADNETTYDGDDNDGTVATPSISYYKACFERDKPHDDANGEACWFVFPHKYDYKNREEENAAGISEATFFADFNNYIYAQKYRNNSVKASPSGALALDPTVQNLNVRFDAAGSGSDTWSFSNLLAHLTLCDDTAPYPVDALYYTQGSNLKHSPVTVTICFNEIVRPFGCVLKTTWGDLPVINTTGYANVLSFCGPIAANPGTTLRITGIEGDVTDLIGNTMTASLSKSLTATVAQSPTLPVSNGVYQISNAAELYAYADMLETYPNRSGKLTADIDMSNSVSAGFTAMAGRNGFTGTFDGDGHKIMNLQNVSGTVDGLCGLFGCVSAGGRVQNLDLDISFTAPLGSSGAICGLNLGTVENCVVSGVIRNSIADSDQSTNTDRFGGVVGDNRGSVVHCLALNELSNRWENPVFGGIVGYNEHIVDSCCFYGVFDSSKEITRGAICGENTANGTVTNCAARNLNTNYYSYAIGSDNGTTTNTLYLSTADFASGKACYDVLNNGVSDGTQFWHQNLDNGETPDEHPRSTGGTVYKHGNTYTNGPVVHTLSHVDAVAASCVDSGCVEYWFCTYDGCGKVFSDENGQNETTLSAVTILPLGHDYAATVTTPTCTEQGYTTHTCSRCGNSYVDDWTAALGHTPGSMWYFGSTTHSHRCTRCNATMDEEPHTYGEANYVWNDDNSRVTATHYCTLCGSAESETARTTIDSSSATCTQGGTAVYRATFTNAAFTTQTKEVPVAALGHDYVTSITDPTCTEQGYTTHTCSRCGDSYVDNWTPALDHDWKTEYNYNETNHWHDCSRCSATTVFEPHTFGEPTWFWGGTSSADATFTCTECGAALNEDAVITSTTSGNAVIYTATVTFNGNPYTDTKTMPLLVLGENTVSAVYREYTYYQFTPSEDSSYSFYSVGEKDPVLIILDEDGNGVGSDDDSGEDNNFYLSVSLEGGKTYEIQLYSYSSTADLTMYIAQTQFYAITVDSQIENGEILVEDEDGNEITGAYDHQLLHVIFNADAGYRPCGLTVTDAGGNVVSDSAAIFCMPASAITVTAAFTTEPLQLGENTVYIESAAQSYSFTPSQDGIYRFYSVGEYDPALYIYYNGNLIDDNDDYDWYNFDLTVPLEGGKTYILDIPSYDTVGVDTGMLTMWIERADLPYDIYVDGVIDERDYDLVVSAALGDVTLTPVQQAKANLNGDDVIDVLDCLEFKRLLNPQP